MDDRRNGCVDAWIDGYLMYVCMYESMGGCLDRWMDGRMDGCRDG